jgi:hypothetical protein
MTLMSLLALGSLKDCLKDGQSSNKDFGPGLGMEETRPNRFSAKRTDLDLFNLAMIAYRYLQTTAEYSSPVTFKVWWTGACSFGLC